MRDDREICDPPARTIGVSFPVSENKVWHFHTVWFSEGNPANGYSKVKGLSWSVHRCLSGEEWGNYEPGFGFCVSLS